MAVSGGNEPRARRPRRTARRAPFRPVLAARRHVLHLRSEHQRAGGNASDPRMRGSRDSGSCGGRVSWPRWECSISSALRRRGGSPTGGTAGSCSAGTTGCAGSRSSRSPQRSRGPRPRAGRSPIFYGLDWVATVPPTARLAADAFGKERVGIMFGWIVAAHQLGAATAAWGAGAVRSAVGDYQPGVPRGGSAVPRRGRDLLRLRAPPPDSCRARARSGATPLSEAGHLGRVAAPARGRAGHRSARARWPTCCFIVLALGLSRQETDALWRRIDEERDRRDPARDAAVPAAPAAAGAGAATARAAAGTRARAGTAAPATARPRRQPPLCRRRRRIRSPSRTPTRPPTRNGPRERSVRTTTPESGGIAEPDAGAPERAEISTAPTIETGGAPDLRPPAAADAGRRRPARLAADGELCTRAAGQVRARGAGGIGLAAGRRSSAS